MSNIRNKISSIEADDNVVSKALGLYPIDDSKAVDPIEPKETPKSEKVERIVKPVAAKESSKRTSKKRSEEALPAIATRRLETVSYAGETTERSPVWIVLGLGLAWLIGSIIASNSLFSLGQIGSFSAAKLGGLAFFILFPLMLLSLVWVALRHLGKITVDARRLRQAADELMQVDETAVRRATEMSGVIKGEIDTLNSGIDTALTRAATLQGVMDEQTIKLGETSLAVEDKTQKITERLTTEREALWSISNAFEQQMKALTETLNTQNEQLALSTKTAEQKIEEARVSVETTASKINQTSDLVRTNTMDAANTLSENQTDILKLSEQLKARASELDQIYQKHSHDLNAMIAQLRNEQESLSETLEERLSKMRDVSLSAQVSAERLTEASEAGRRTVTSLSEAAKLSESTIKQRFTEMEEMVQFSNDRAESINEKAARRVQDSLSQTRKEISRIESDMLGLQEKLSETSKIKPSEPQTAPKQVQETQEPDNADYDLIQETPPKKSRGFLNIHPIVDDEGGKDDDTNATDAKTSSSALVAGLRPAPSTDTEIMVEPVVDLPELPSSPVENDLDLKVENGLMRPALAADKETNGLEDRIERRLPEGEPAGGWWKNLFGSSKSGGAQTPITPILASAAVRTQDTRPKDIPVSTPDDDLTHQDFLAILAENGLTPSAIIDDGTILSAIDARIDKGTKHMSNTVNNRIGQPIQHFSKLINSNEDLKSHAVNFAVKFHHGLTPVADNAMGMRQRLESDDGRLFLMCDAALNT